VATKCHLPGWREIFNFEVGFAWGNKGCFRKAEVLGYGNFLRLFQSLVEKIDTCQVSACAILAKRPCYVEVFVKFFVKF